MTHNMLIRPFAFSRWASL